VLIDFSGLDWLKSFTMLTELTLHFPYHFEIAQRHRLDITQLLSIVGDRLETLRLYSLQLKFDTNAIPKYPLKNLTLFKVTLTPKADLFITQSFPSLETNKNSLLYKYLYFFLI
jgi:hypothetical protein